MIDLLGAAIRLKGAAWMESDTGTKLHAVTQPHLPVSLCETIVMTSKGATMRPGTRACRVCLALLEKGSEKR